jgi:excisionase family DNA binding protein
MNPQERRWIRADEVAELLHLNLKSVYRAVKSGKLPGCRVPGVGLRLDRLAIDKLLEGTAAGDNRGSCPDCNHEAKARARDK